MNIFNNIIFWENCSVTKRNEILKRPIIFSNKNIKKKVKKIIKEIKKYGDKSLSKYTLLFDKLKLKSFNVSKKNILNSHKKINKKFKKHINISFKNINNFHEKQINDVLNVKIQSGINCQQIFRPIDSVGLYIPGGTSPLVSTILMLSIPAKIAGCKNIIMCSPPPISHELLYTANLCGIKKIFSVGGAQAIAALAYGTETIPQVNKIFGPGNAYVTEAKMQLIQECNGETSIDFPAGPSELMIISENVCKPDFIAADFLSQLEHGLDSQSILLVNDINLANEVCNNLNIQINNLSKKKIILKSLKKSYIIITKNIKESIDISNIYAPEHLIIHSKFPRKILEKINNAGSIFLGEWSPESVGDYASGTNHVLPTYGYAKSYSGLSIYDFQKRIFVQELTPEGLIKLSKTVKYLSDFENMDAHKNSVKIRTDFLKEKNEYKY
ncbi:histidinol dehydrogenase [Buchnera aphidicola (Taiwanaphis decaspermi)]|uniref:histidinol dehydrogenase n=1 Tax=Buchnera aphidicola TaxID=9 RepID=UPI0031B891D7